MIPGTALGVVFVVAAFGPGYLYLRVAERRTFRNERSGLVEAVELAVVGAFASILALLGVGAIADLTGIVGVHQFSDSPHVFLAHHPLRVIWVLALALAAAYGLAYGVALLLNRQKPTIHPGTSWIWAMQPARTDITLMVRATVELRDGRKIEGTVVGHTAEVAENKELLLKEPIRAQPAPGLEAQKVPDEFIVLREADMIALSGRFYARPESSASGANAA